MGVIRRLAALGLAMAVGAGAACLGSAYLTPPCDAGPSEPAYDTAVVLSAGVRPDGRLGPVSAARAEAAAGLYRDGRVRRLVFTGAGRAGTEGSVAAAMARRATAGGVPVAARVVEPRAQSTLENARLSAPLLAEGARVVLVSSGYHLWRGAASFAWARRPVDGLCRSAPFDGARLDGILRITTREIAKWWGNALRAGIWSAAAAAGHETALPDWWLH